MFQGARARVHNVNNRRRYTIEAVALGLLSVAVLAPWGCSPAPRAPAPVIPGQAFELPNGVIAVPGRLLGEVEPAAPETFELVPLPYTFDSTTSKDTTRDMFGPFIEDITSGGGTIVIDISKDTSFFTVPEEGLKTATEISISVRRDLSLADARITEFDFEPEGLKFDAPAELSYATSLPEGELLLLYWWDRDRGEWMKSAEAPVVKGYATFPIEHFSKYRTTEKISLGGQQ